MGWKIKLGIAVFIIILLAIIAPNLFGTLFQAGKETAIGCKQANEDIIKGAKSVPPINLGK